MSDYKIVVKRTPGIRQQYRVLIVASNGENLFTSENYKNPAYALELGQNFAQLLDGNLINAIPEDG